MVRQTNHNTHTLRLAIRDKCERGGRMWYEKNILLNFEMMWFIDCIFVTVALQC